MARKFLPAAVLLVIVMMIVTWMPIPARAAPTISEMTFSPKYPQYPDTINITAKVQDAVALTGVTLFYCSDPGGVCFFYDMDGPDVNQVYNYTVAMFPETMVPRPIGAHFWIEATNVLPETTKSGTVYIQYALSVNATMTADKSQTAPGEIFNLTINALYWSNLSAPVEYSDVNITLSGGTQYWTGTTDENGNLTMEMTAPSVDGSYTYNASITNRSKTGYAEASILVFTTPKPDLAISNTNVTISPSVVYVNDNVTANITVRNQGTLNASFNVLVTLFNGVSTQTLTNQSVTIESKNHTIIQVTWKAVEGPQKLNVTLDPGNTVDEISETNNFVSITVTGQTHPPPPTDGQQDSSALILYAVVAIIILVVIIAMVMAMRKKRGPQTPPEE